MTTTTVPASSSFRRHSIRSTSSSPIAAWSSNGRRASSSRRARRFADGLLTSMSRGSRVWTGLGGLSQGGCQGLASLQYLVLLRDFFSFARDTQGERLHVPALG